MLISNDISYRLLRFLTPAVLYKCTHRKYSTIPPGGLTEAKLNNIGTTREFVDIITNIEACYTSIRETGALVFNVTIEKKGLQSQSKVE